MARVFQIGPPADYIQKLNETLTPWLSSEQAYYPEARPQILALFKVKFYLRRLMEEAKIMSRRPTIVS